MPSDDELRDSIKTIVGIAVLFSPDKAVVGQTAKTVNKATECILKEIAADRRALLERLATTLGLDTESYGAIPAERVRAVLNAELAALPDAGEKK